MSPKLESTQLYKWLTKANSSLAQRVVLVRDEQAKWLPLIIATYPHYPGHGVEHSERIIAQLSNMLFNGGRPVVKFSAAEVYCLLCAGYLHDSGMVLPPGEIETILSSGSWKEFVAVDGKGHENFKKFDALRKARNDGSQERADFLAGQALRYLIADFARRDHHERGKTTLEMHPFLKQLVSDNDSVAFETIASVGVGHGLPRSELADESRFPEERDVFHEKVNVRFLARLLRIGDLLDMSTNRADPLTARGVGPLPPDAVPHWQQYSAKKHERISPEAIEFRFECEDQETHRILRDWFGWLEEEVRDARLEQMHAVRHDKWLAPKCSVSSQASADAPAPTPTPTILIKPSHRAKYTFHDWKLELDHEQVLQRLISDVYDDPSVFVRELIQNALDATRCQMYADFEAQNPDVPPPTRPTQFDRKFRERYPVLVSLTEENVPLTPDGPTEKRHVLTVEDRGTGMNEEIIQRYFLQVGRSYYQSAQFRERFKFAPTSRFGVGFLSVFAVSDDVTVETARIGPGTAESAGIKLRLRGPKSYLLTETWDAFTERAGQTSRHGTRIRVVLATSRGEQSLENLVRQWCVRVEVPIRVRDGDDESVVRHVPLKDGEILAESCLDPKARFVQRVFDVDRDGIEGQMVVLAYCDEQGEGWCDCWSREKNLAGKRMDVPPLPPRQFVALHGIRSGFLWRDRPGWRETPWVNMIDIRADGAAAPMARMVALNMPEEHFLVPTRQDGATGTNERATAACEVVAQEAVKAHLAYAQRATGERGIYYVGKVLSVAPVSKTWRSAYPNAIITWERGKRVDRSASDLLALGRFALAYWQEPWFGASAEPLPPIVRHPSTSALGCPILSFGDTPEFVEDRLKNLVKGMTVISVEQKDDLWIIEFGEAANSCSLKRAIPDTPWYLVDLGANGPITAFPSVHSISSELWSLFNFAHPVVQWLLRLRDAADATESKVKPAEVLTAWSVMAHTPWSFDECVGRWRNAPGLSKELSPPSESQLKGGRLFPCQALGGRRTIITNK